MSFPFSRILTAALVFAGATAGTQAAVIGDDATATGVRTVASGQLISGAANQWGAAEIEWEITDNLDGTWTYLYTFRNFGGPTAPGGPNGSDFNPGISHLSLQVTDDVIVPADNDLGFTWDADAVTDIMIDTDHDGVFDTFPDDAAPEDVNDVVPLKNAGSPGATDLPGVDSVKFDIGEEEDEDEFGEFLLKFTSNRAPVWGHVAVKGSTQTLYNAGWFDVDSDMTEYFIARPNGSGTPRIPGIPTPAALPAGLALLGLGLLRRRRVL